MPDIEVLQRIVRSALHASAGRSDHRQPGRDSPQAAARPRAVRRTQRHSAGASLPAPRGAGSGRRRGRFAEAFADGGQDRRRRHRFLRRAFHGRNRGDSLPRQNGAAAGSARGLFAGRVRSPPKSCAKWKAKLPGCRGGLLHQHFGGRESGERLLLHVGERRESGAARFPPTGRFFFFPTNFWPPWWRGRPDAATSSPIRAIATCTRPFAPNDVVELLDEHPDIELLLHPECGCVSSCMAKADGRHAAAGPHLLPFHRRHASPHRRFAGRRICRGHGAGHHAPAAQEISRRSIFIP